MSVINFIAAAGGGGGGAPGAGDYDLIDTISATAKPFIDAGPIVVSRDGLTVFAVGQDGSALGVWVWRWNGSSFPNIQIIALGTPGDFTAATQMPQMSLACSEDGTRVVLGMRNAVSDDGRVYVFDETSADTWTQYQRIAPPSAGAAGLFGADVDITNDGSRIVVGEAAYFDGVQGFGRGHVYLDSGSAFALEATLADNSENGFGSLGSAACISGDGSVVVLGNPAVFSPLFIGLGALEGYTRSGTTWTFQSRAYATEDDPLFAFSRPGAVVAMDEAGTRVLSCDWIAVYPDSAHYTLSGGVLSFVEIVYGLGLSGSGSLSAAMAMAGDASSVALGDFPYSTSRGRLRRWSGPTSWASDVDIDSASPTNNQQHSRGVSTTRDGGAVVWSECPTAANASTSLGDRAYMRVF